MNELARVDDLRLRSSAKDGLLNRSSLMDAGEREVVWSFAQDAVRKPSFALDRRRRSSTLASSFIDTRSARVRRSRLGAPNLFRRHARFQLFEPVLNDEDGRCGGLGQVPRP